MRGRTGLIVLAGGAAVVMAWAAWSPVRQTAPPGASRGATSRAAADAAGDEALAIRADRLEHAGEQAPSPRTTRNPFQFAAPKAKAPPAPRAERPPALIVPPGSSATSEPAAPFSLSGIAQRTTEQGPLRIAVLATPRALYHVEQGGVVLGRYRVTAITASSARVLDLETGRTFDLVLKAR